MSFQGDPFRTLGIAPGASLNEIKSAYRRLAKQYHPDTAGERALPRFLAIQAAYERLVDGEGRLRPPGGAGRPSAPRPADAPRADSSRARASRDAWRARRSTGGASATSGSRPGFAGGRARTGPTADDGGGSDAGADDGAAANAAPGEAGHDRRRREQHARRGPRKATPGSTTYDEAGEAPLDPAWDGGAWYGPSSGTYWTINPREYADPRKHGPEYQERARRATRADPADPSATADPAESDDQAQPRGEAGDADPAWAWNGAAGSSTEGGGAWGARSWRYDDASTEPGDDAAGEAWSGSAADRAWAPGRRSAAGTGAAPREDVPFPDLESIARRFAPRNLLALARRPDRRWLLVLAIAGWPPLGYALGSLIGELTGCASYLATCPQPLPVVALLLQPLVVVALFLVPPAAAVAAFGSVVALATALPVAAVLSMGSLPESRAGAPVLMAAVLVAYVAGLAWGARAVWHAPGEPGGGAPGS